MSYYCEKCKQQREQGCFGPRCPGIPKHANTDALPPPVMRERAPLSIQELLRMYDDCGGDWCKVARAVESAHGIGA